MPAPTSTSDNQTRPDASRRAAIRAYIALLTGTPQPGELLELRYRRASGGMTRRFYPAGPSAGLVATIERLGRRCDVYLGCAPRTHRSGGRDAIERSWVLWADCDTPAAHAALNAFLPAPTLVVASGSPHGRHAYWALTHSAGVATLEDANRRLAHLLGADPACTDAPRILRPPGTRNFKHEPTDVLTIEHRPDRRYRLDELLEQLPPLPRVESSLLSANAGQRPRGGDPLLAIPPDVYLPVLIGQRGTRDRKVRCPFHEDATPSLHVYSDHWYCFGCRRGGTIYDLGGHLWQLSTRGPEFLELRRRLQHRFTGTWAGN